MSMAATPISTAASGRLLALDGLRGCLALSVVFFHFCVGYQQRFDGAGGEHWFTVIPAHLFFLISGFSIGLSLTRTVHATQFIVARFTRIFPLYWATLLISIAVLAWSGLPGPALNSRDILTNAALLQNWLGAPDYTGVAGLLGPELVFYVLIFAVFCFGRIDRLETLASLWLTAEVTWHFLSRHWALPGWIAPALLLQQAHLFLAGLIFHRIRLKGISTTRLWLLAGCLIVEHVLHGFIPGFALVVAFPLFFMLSWSKLGGLRAGLLVFLGTISYALFLVHENIGYALIRSVTKTGGPYVGGVFLALAVSIVLATILTFAVERPLRGLAHRRRSSEETETPTAPELEVSKS